MADVAYNVFLEQFVTSQNYTRAKLNNKKLSLFNWIRVYVSVSNSDNGEAMRWSPSSVAAELFNQLTPSYYETLYSSTYSI